MSNNGKVTMTIEESGLNENKPEYEVIFINGVRTEIRKGEYVEVPPVVKEVYEESRNYHKKGNTQRKPLIMEG